MEILVVSAVFVVAMVVVNRVLRRREQAGDYDVGPSSASRPGLKMLLDLRREGFGGDGIRQRPRQPER